MLGGKNQLGEYRWCR